MIKHSEKFAPYRFVVRRTSCYLETDSLYRSVFMWYMWRVEDVDTNVIEEA